jgi:hypothetical protein
MRPARSGRTTEAFSNRVRSDAVRAGGGSSATCFAIASSCRRNEPVDETQLQRLRGLDGAAGEHQLHGGKGPRELYRAHGAAEAWMQAELHFGKAQLHPRIVGGDSIAAGEGDFQASAQREAVDGRHAHALQGGKAVQHPLTFADQLERLERRADADELLDVRSGDETALRRRDDQCPRQCALEAGQHRVQLFHDLARKAVRR